MIERIPPGRYFVSAQGSSGGSRWLAAPPKLVVVQSGEKTATDVRFDDGEVELKIVRRDGSRLAGWWRLTLERLGESAPRSATAYIVNGKPARLRGMCSGTYRATLMRGGERLIRLVSEPFHLDDLRGAARVTVSAAPRTH